MHYVTVVLLNLASKLQVMWIVIVFADFHKNNPCLMTEFSPVDKANNVIGFMHEKVLILTEV